MFNLNGKNYDRNQLSEEGKQILQLLTEAQNEVKRIETQKSLLQAAQQELINRLKPLLPDPIYATPKSAAGIRGEASNEIPTTPTEKPEEEPAPFTDNIPEHFRLQP